jgi:hypothetical protein
MSPRAARARRRSHFRAFVVLLNKGVSPAAFASKGGVVMRKLIPAPLLVLVALGLLLSLPGGALAAAPGFHDNIDDTFADNICGVSGTSHVTGVQLGTLGPTSFLVNGAINQTFTADDGRVAILHVAGRSYGTFTDNGDGTATTVNTYKGLPEQIRGSHGGVVSQDVGLITFVTTFDLTTGDVISSSVVEHGPHPEADSGFAIFCDAFLTALG